jgi:hypothetical protein
MEDFPSGSMLSASNMEEIPSGSTNPASDMAEFSAISVDFR